MPERAISLRIAVKDAQAARQRLLELGEAGEQALAKIESGAPRATAAMQQLDRGVVRGSTNMRFALGNASAQIQDVIVSLQGGQDPLRVFIQQGSQLASAFGPMGVIVGTVAAGIGVLAGALFAYSSDAEAAEKLTKDLDDALFDQTGSIDDLIESYRELSEVKRESERLDITSELRREAEAAEQLRDRIADLSEAEAERIRRETIVRSASGKVGGGTSLERDLGGEAIGAEIERLVGLYKRGAIGAEELATGIRQLRDEIGDAATEELAELERALGASVNALTETEEKTERLTEAMAAMRGEITETTKEREGAARADERAAKDAERAAERAAREAERIAAQRQRTADKVIADLKREAEAIDKEAARRDAADERKAQQEADRQQRDLEREAQATADLLNQPFENFLRSLQSETSNVFREILDGGVKSFSDLFDLALGLAKDFAAEMAALALFNPQTVTGLAGGSDSLAAALGFGGPGSGIAEGEGATRGGQIPVTSGFNTGGAISGGIAGIGAGTASGTAVGGDPTYAAVGSAVGAVIGAIIGTYFGGQTAIGAFVGGTVGGLAGGLLGGSGGGPDSTNASASGALGGIRVSGSNAGEVEGFLREFDREILQLLTSRQEEIVNEALLRAGSIDRSFTGFTPDVALSIAQQRARPIARELGFRPGAITNAGSPTGILANLQNALEIQRAIEDLTGTVTAFERQTEALDDTFAELESGAKRFGISIDGLADAQKEAEEDLRRQQDAQLLGLLDPFEALIGGLEAFQTQLGFIGATPQEQFLLAQEDFRRIAEEAAGGSTTALEQLGEAGRLFIQMADIVGASPAAAAAQNEVRLAVEKGAADAKAAQEEAKSEIKDAIDRASLAEIDTLQELIDETKKLARKLERVTV